MTFVMKMQEERKEGLKEGILKAITMLKNLKLDKKTAALVNSNW